MAQWVTLTYSDGQPIDINMDNILHMQNKSGKTVLRAVSGDDIEVKESTEQIKILSEKK